MNFNIVERHRNSPNRRYIDMSFSQKALDNLTFVLATATRPDPTCAIVMGPNGTGKTSLISVFSNEANIHFKNNKSIIIVQVKNILSEKTFHSLMLEELGDLSPTKGTLDQLDVRLRALINNLGVQMVIFDDYHQLVEERGRAFARKMTDTIKALCNKTYISAVFVGLPVVEEVLDINEQIDSRFTNRIMIPKQTIVAEGSRQQFANFLESYCKLHEVKMDFDLTNEDSLLHFYCATEGNLRVLVNVLEKAKLEGWNENKSAITKFDLAEIIYDMKPRHLIIKSGKSKIEGRFFHGKTPNMQNAHSLRVIPFASPISAIKKELGVAK